MDSSERLDKAAAQFKSMEERIRDLECRQELVEQTMFAKREEMLKGYKLMAEIHLFYVAEHSKFVDELKRRIDELSNKEVKG